MLDDAGQPVAGAPVTVERDPQFMGLGGFEVREGQSAADGSFVLEAVTPGEAKLAVDPDGLLDARTDVTVVEGRRVDIGDLTVNAGSTIAGSVTWPDGSPVEGARIEAEFDRSQLAGMGAFNAMRGYRSEAESDAEGHFLVRGLGAGPFRVRATADVPVISAVTETKPSWSATEWKVAPDGPQLELVLRAPVGIGGRVVDPQGEPVTVYTLRARLPSSGSLGAIDHEARTEWIDDELVV